MAQVMPAKSYARITYKYALPPLIDVQVESFKRLKKEGMMELLNEISPIESYNEKMRLYFPSDSIEAEQWEDPAGFSFSYNKLMEVNDNPEDEINYANLQLQMADRSGEITIIVNDTDYADIDEWSESDETVVGGSVLDTKVAGLSAKKISLPGNQKVISGFIDADGVLYLIGLDLGKDSSFWQRNYELILSSFELVPLEGEAEDSLRLIETDAGSGAEGFDGEVIYEAEEVIE